MKADDLRDFLDRITEEQRIRPTKSWSSHEKSWIHIASKRVCAICGVALSESRIDPPRPPSLGDPSRCRFARALCLDCYDDTHHATKSRSQKTEMRPVEFCWSHSWGGGWNPHRIVKRTSTRIYVEEDWWRDGRFAKRRPKCVALPRERLEAGEAVDRKYESWRLSRPEGRTDDVPACAAALGIPWPSSATEIRAAYRRRAREVHPDVGGCADAFRALSVAYGHALKLANLPGEVAA